MAVLQFYLLRLLAFLVPFVAYYAVGLGLVFSTIFATLTGICLSYLFLNKYRGRAVGSIAQYLARPRAKTPSVAEMEDNDYEDSAVDRACEEGKQRGIN